MLYRVPHTLYLDHNATTPCDPRVLAEMLPLFSESFWNPSSIHSLGRKAAHLLESSRERCARALGRSADEVVFTAGATEGIQLCLDSLPEVVIRSMPLYSAGIEHRAVQNAIARLCAKGARHASLELRKAIVEVAQITGPGVYVVQAANSETGVIQPIRRIADAVHKAGGLLICDAAQALWKVDVTDFAQGPDAVVLSSHKAYGPKGVGALLLSHEFKALLRRARLGEAQEQGLREGTHNLPGIVGMAVTAELAVAEGRAWREAAISARSAFETTLSLGCDRASLNFQSSLRLPNTSSVRFAGVEGDALVLNCPAAISYGSACSSGAPGPSSTLLSSGIDRIAAHETVRVSFGRDHSAADGELAAELLTETIDSLNSRDRLPTV